MASVTTADVWAAARDGTLDALPAGADLDVRDRHSWTALLSAAEHGLEPSVRALLAAGASPRQTTDLGNSALHCAAGNGHIACVRTLLAAGADPDQATGKGATPLLWAASKGHIACVEALLAAGADAGAAEPGGRTPLHAAARAGNAAVLDLLLRTGVSPDKTAPGAGTALMVAVGACSLPCVELLLAAGADVNRANMFRETPLRTACSSGHLPCALALLARPDVRIRAGEKGPLYAAAHAGNLEVVRALVGHAAVDLSDPLPVRGALSMGRRSFPVVNALLRAGASFSDAPERQLSEFRQWRAQRTAERVAAVLVAERARVGRHLARAVGEYL